MISFPDCLVDVATWLFVGLVWVVWVHLFAPGHDRVEAAAAVGLRQVGEVCRDMLCSPPHSQRAHDVPYSLVHMYHELDYVMIHFLPQMRRMLEIQDRGKSTSVVLENG